MGKMTVYHGSYTTVKKPQIRKGKNTKDFGIGFYCTIIRYPGTGGTLGEAV